MDSISATRAIPISSELIPKVGSRLTGNGIVISHDVTRFGLHRMKVERAGGYPSLEAWCAWIEMVGGKVATHYLEEQAGREFIGCLWLFWKMQ
jgi:hypothetical protein